MYLVNKLFGSKTRTKLLELFLSNPNRAFYVREITRKVDEQINSVRRELANLLSLGIISSDSTNNKLYYEVDQKYEKYGALRELFTGKRENLTTKLTKNSNKKNVVDQQIKSKEMSVDNEIWSKVGNIAGLIYSGVLTRDSKSPVDVLIIGNAPVSRVEAAISELEKQEGKELRYAVLSVDEWNYRRQINDKFWSQISFAKNLTVLDTDNIFEQK
jgi:predicted transcriptional regulator